MILVSILNDTIPFHLFSFYISAFQHVTFDDLFLKSVSLIAVDIFSESSQFFNWFLVLFQHKNTILRLHYFKSKKRTVYFVILPLDLFVGWMVFFARKYQNLAWFTFIIIRLSIFIIMTLSVLILHLLLLLLFWH